MCITTKIYDIRRLYGGITEARARSALLSHAHRCNTSLDTMLVWLGQCFVLHIVMCLRLHQHKAADNALVYTQAAYNNTSEIELESGDVPVPGESELSLFPVGTKVAKQFEDSDQQLVWFEGAMKRIDEGDKLYWVLYTDGDSEDMDEAEVRDAVHNYRVHLQQNEATVNAADEAVSSAPSITSVDVEMTDTTRLTLNNAAHVADTGASQSPSNPDPSELAAAMQAMTAAAERLASAATRIEAAVQQQRREQSQQPQQVISVLPNWQLHDYWQHVRLQQQQQQQWLVHYQQRQQQMHSFRWQCRR
jgi:hypothetical protein